MRSRVPSKIRESHQQRAQAVAGIRVTASYPHEVTEDSKSGACFQRRRTEPELEGECTHEFVLTTTLP